jgi:methylphosphotriester-DNA--protein-cysteine methyltransferase
MRTGRTFLVLLMVTLLGIAAVTGTAEKIVYHGNTDSEIFHKPSCRHYNCKNCTMKSNSRQEATDAGHRPSKVSNP